MFEGYGSFVMTAEEFLKSTATSLQSAMLHAVLRNQQKERRTVVVKTDHSAVIADLKYIYFCADYVINN